MSNIGKSGWRLVFGVLCIVFVALAVWRLEAARAGVERILLSVGQTPATLYKTPDANGPLVVVAHGFAGSRQLMEAISLTLARSGYSALAFDFQGHGRNPVPMGGDVTAIEGTTMRLIAETRRVIDAGLGATGTRQPVAIVGHSMASDIVIRTALLEPRVGPVVAISMFSEAVTPRFPERLLMVTGEWEAALREVALGAMRMVDPQAAENETVRDGEIMRRAAIAPNVEHVGVLYSPAMLREMQAWLDEAYGRTSPPGTIAATGGWIALMLAGIVGAVWSLSALLPQSDWRQYVPLKIFVAAVLAPALVVPLVATQVTLQFLPVLVADYLALHLLLYGLLQLAILYAAGLRFGPVRPAALLALLILGGGAFGLALDRYVASFLVSGARLPVFAGIAAGAVPFMLADALLSEAGRAALWRRLALRSAFLISLGLAVAIDFDRLMFLFIILPVIVLFFIIFGLMGRGFGLRAGPLTSGLALGLILAWSLAASFPLFDAASMR